MAKGSVSEKGWFLFGSLCSTRKGKEKLVSTGKTKEHNSASQPSSSSSLQHGTFLGGGVCFDTGQRQEGGYGGSLLLSIHTNWTSRERRNEVVSFLTFIFEYLFEDLAGCIARSNQATPLVFGLQLMSGGRRGTDLVLLLFVLPSIFLILLTRFILLLLPLAALPVVILPSIVNRPNYIHISNSPPTLTFHSHFRFLFLQKAN